MMPPGRNIQRRIAGLIFGLLFTMGTATLAWAELPPVNTTLGVAGGEDTVEGFIDLIGPVWAPGNGLLFLNPRVSLRDQGENAFNIGLGYRHLLPETDMLLGVNAFFDSHESRYGNRFNQFGGGLEFLSKWVDARANIYLPDNDKEVAQSYWQTEVDANSCTTSKWDWQNIRPTGHTIIGDGTQTTTTTTTTTTTRRLFEMFETAVDGWDAEVGGRLPLPDSFPEIRLFGGYYSFEGDYGEDIEGLKGRLELRTGPYLTFDAQVFEDKELNNSDYFVGVRLQIPFSGTNPFSEFDKIFTPAPRTQQERQSRELVMRDMRIQTDISDYMENTGARTDEVNTYIQVDKNTETLVLADKLTFVDGDATGPTEDGTAENPFNLIQEGSDNAGSNNTILVDDATGGYYEQVVLANNQILTSAVDLRYNAGTYQSDQIPNLAWGGYPATLILGNNNVVRRMGIGGNGGIWAAGIRNAVIQDVRIRTNPPFPTYLPSLLIFDSGGNIQIVDSVIENHGLGEAVYIDLSGELQASILIDNSHLTTNPAFPGASDAMHVDLYDNARLNLVLQNSILDGADDALEVHVYDNNRLDLTVVNSTLAGFSDGIVVELYNTSQANVSIGNNIITAEVDEGIEFDVEDNSRLSADIYGNRITAFGGLNILGYPSGTSNYGLEVDVDDYAFADITVRDNTIVAASSDAINVDLTDNSTTNLVISGNFLKSPRNGVDIITSDSARLSGWITNNTIKSELQGIEVIHSSANTTHGTSLEISGNSISSGPGLFDINLANYGNLFTVHNLPMLSDNNFGATWTNNGTSIQDCLDCPDPLLP